MLKILSFCVLFSYFSSTQGYIAEKRYPQSTDGSLNLSLVGLELNGSRVGNLASLLVANINNASVNDFNYVATAQIFFIRKYITFSNEDGCPTPMALCPGCTDLLAGQTALYSRRPHKRTGVSI